jgi:Cu(I)/Ag(I) efflux system membrane protein CusA/SilA
VYIDVRGRDLSSVVADLRQAVDSDVKLDPGVSLSYSGQFEYLERANARLAWVVPATLAIIFVLLYLTFGRLGEALLIMGTCLRPHRRRVVAVPDGFQPVGGHRCWLHCPGRGRGGIRSDHADLPEQRLAERQANSERTQVALLEAIREGAVQRIRPKAMTVAVIVAGLLPILWSSGTGSEVMSRIAVPMVAAC